MTLKQNLVFILESQTIFCSIHKSIAYQLHDQPQRSTHATDLELAPFCSIFSSVVLVLSKEYGSKIPDLQIDSSVCYVITV